MSVASGYGSGIFPEGTDFPFVAPSSDIRGMFEDMYLSFDTTITYSYPLKVTSVSGFQFATPSIANLVISDSNNTVVFNTTGSTFSQRAWGADRVIYYWQSGKKILTAVQYVGSGAVERSPSFSPTNAVLDERAYQKECTKVNSISINNVQYQGDFEIVAGYNMVVSLTPTTDVEGSRKINYIQMAAVSGEGQGIYPNCPENCVSDAITNINGVTPDQNGNVAVIAKDCYWQGVEGQSNQTLYRPSASHQLSIRNNCSPCCECNDFVNTYKGIQNVYSKFKDLGDRSMRGMSQHYANQERWLAAKEQRDQASMRVFALPIQNGAASSVVTYCNTTSNFIGPIYIEITLDGGGKTGGLSSDSVIWYPTCGSSPVLIDPEGEWPTYRFRWDTIGPGKSAKIRFNAYLNNGTSADFISISAQTIFEDEEPTVIGTAIPYSVGLRS